MPFIKHTAAALADVAQDAGPAQHAQRLASPDAAVRRAAAHALADRPDAVPVLAAALEDEPEQAVRSALLGALARIGSEEAVAALAGCLRREDAWLRNTAIDVLRGLPDRVDGAIAHLLVDWDRDVRILAVGILDTLRHERVEEWLLQLIEADEDVNVCGAALDVLAGIATEAARAPVARLLARFADEPYIAFAGKLVLARLAG
ncbi:HEAT repeat domain-containing protein [Massilia consociata]|uniref:HEAT repeat domain-containing protein n=1 Tax=Massilia consociata TaxID=760117 RepID=A0ABV6FIF4_9BURK